MKVNFKICSKCRHFTIFAAKPYSKYCFMACDIADSEDDLIASAQLIKKGPGRVVNTIDNTKNIEKRKFEIPQSCPYILEHTIK